MKFRGYFTNVLLLSGVVFMNWRQYNDHCTRRHRDQHHPEEQTIKDLCDVIAVNINQKNKRSRTCDVIAINITQKNKRSRTCDVIAVLPSTSPRRTNDRGLVPVLSNYVHDAPPSTLQLERPRQKTAGFLSAASCFDCLCTTQNC